MTQDFAPCPKCSNTMPVYSALVQNITWCGKAVCGECASELRKILPMHRNLGAHPSTVDIVKSLRLSDKDNRGGKF